jgi:iron complex outermembrane recepter protein
MSSIASHSSLRRSQLLLGASLAALLCSNPAIAQDVSSPPPAPQTDDVIPPTDDQAEANLADQLPPEVAPAATATGDTIVVTGSRIRQTEFTSPDPVTSIDPETSQREGKFDTAEMLQSSPIAAGSTQITSAISSNFVTDGGPGAQTIDLRGLGANRTLVLLNGRRAGPAGTRGGVSSFDLNVLPQSIVQRVEILKTGASSIYGSDAVAGVVNLITKTQLDGFQIDANGSIPTRSGGEQFRISGMWGKTFDRGHVMVALDYFKQKELARGDRSYLGCPEAYTFRPNSNERADLIDPRTGRFRCEDFRWGHVWTYDLERIFGIGPGNLFNTEGVNVGIVNLIQFQYPGENLGIPGIDPNAGLVAPLITPPGWFPTGYSPASFAVQNAFHPIPLAQTLIPETDRYSVYADAAYQLTDNIEAFAEFLGNRRETYQNGWRQFWTFGYTGDIYGDGSYGTFWAQDWSGFNWLSPTGITDQFDSSQKVDYWRGVGGIRGDFGGFLNGWSFDAHVQYSHNKGRYRQQQLLQDIYDISYFQTASCVGTVTPVSGKQCIDLPWLDPFFLAGQMTPEQINFLFDWEEGRTIYTQLTGEGSVTGNLFHLPAGPVGLAVGVQARRDRIHDRPGEITLAGNAWGASASGITAGHSTTMEAFGEILVPILKDVPMFRDLSFSGAARLTNVKSVQADTGVSDRDTGNWTYKIGGNWAVTDWLRFRGTYGTSFRAPALFEQFKANETGFVANRQIDPCVNWGQALEQGTISQRIADNCAAHGIPPNYIGGSISATVFSQGGIGVLDPETSTAKTASVILDAELQVPAGHQA